MLVLSRKTNEETVIITPSGDEIRVTVVELRGDKVRIGFGADRKFTIQRREVLDAIRSGDPKSPVCV